MGNEHSKNKDLTKNGKISEKHENGSVNGLSANITLNGSEIDVNGETIVQQNGGTHSLNLAAESTEPNFVVVESNCQRADAPVISEILETTIQKEEVKKSKEEKVHLFGKMFKKKAEPSADVKSVQEEETSKEDQTDVSLPATDPQPASGSSGDEAAAMIITEHRVDFEYLHQKAEISTQTDKKTETDISTQTGGDDDDHHHNNDTTTNSEGPVEEVVMMETAATEEDSLDECAVVIAEEAVEDAADEEPLDIQTTGIIIEEVVMENNVYENIVFRVERVEVTDSFEVDHIKIYDPEEQCGNEPESEVAAEPQSNPNKSIIEGEIAAEENNAEEAVPLEIFCSLPKVVADCVEAVFDAVSESADFVVNTSEPSVDEVITEDNGEGARDTSADALLIETAEPDESDVVTPEAGDANGVPSQDEEPVTVRVETILEVVCEEPNLAPASKGIPGEELSAPLMTEIVVKVESADEEVTADEAIAVEDAPEIIEEFIIAEAPTNDLIISEELPEDTFNSPDEVMPEVITTDEGAEISEDVTADVGPETVEEAEPSPVTVKGDAEEIPQAAIDALSEEFELDVTHQEREVDNGIPLEEEVIAATTFVPLSAEPEENLTVPEEPCETVAEELNEEAIEALSNEIEAVPESVEDDTTAKESSTGGEVTVVASSEEPVEEKTEISEDVLAHAESAETSKQIPVISEEPVEENPSLCETTEALENILESVVEAISEKLEVIESVFEEPAREKAEVPQMEATGEPEPSVQEELVEENVAPADVLLEDADKAAPSEEPVEESASLLEPQVLVVILETTEDDVTEQITHETNNSGDVLAAVDEISEDSQIATSDEPVDECVAAVLETIVEEVITEDIAAVTNLVTSEEAAPEIITEEESEEKAENESSGNLKDSTQSAEMSEDAPVTNTDMEDLLVRLQSACTSLVEESTYRLGGLRMSSLRYNITITIHVAPKEEEQ